MRIYIDNEYVIIDKHQNVGHDYRGFVISCAKGHLPHHGEEIIIFPADKKELKNKYDIPLLHEQFLNIGAAVHAIDKLADAIELGIFEFDEGDEV